jgi:hypothetical protein
MGWLYPNFFGWVEPISCFVRGVELSQFTCLIQRQIDVG